MLMSSSLFASTGSRSDSTFPGLSVCSSLPHTSKTGLHSVRACACARVYTHQISQQHTAKHAHQCHAHGEPGVESSSCWWLKNQTGSTLTWHASLPEHAPHVRPHICAPDGEGHLINQSSTTAGDEIIPHVFCPP